MCETYGNENRGFWKIKKDVEALPGSKYFKCPGLEKLLKSVYTLWVKEKYFIEEMDNKKHLRGLKDGYKKNPSTLHAW